MALWSRWTSRFFHAVRRAFTDPVTTVVLQERSRSYELRYERDQRLAELRDRHGWVMATWTNLSQDEGVTNARTFLASRSYDQLRNPVFDRPLRNGDRG